MGTQTATADHSVTVDQAPQKLAALLHSEAGGVNRSAGWLFYALDEKTFVRIDRRDPADGVCLVIDAPNIPGSMFDFDAQLQFDHGSTINQRKTGSAAETALWNIVARVNSLQEVSQSDYRSRMIQGLGATHEQASGF